MKRNIIKVDEEKCNGCGLCVTSCHEGALQIINGKAKLVSDSYCDGLGACLPACPMDALKIIERDADDFDEELVSNKITSKNIVTGCPSTIMRVNNVKFKKYKKDAEIKYSEKNDKEEIKIEETNLIQWPCQIRLVSPNAPFFRNCDLLIAADCTAFAYPNIQSIMDGKVTIIGCPKLDDVDYSLKLRDIIVNNNINSITLIRMEVPCCGGIQYAASEVIKNLNSSIEIKTIIVSIDGKII